ncbi:MAG TPA: FIST N-terminal domain-containing protein [Burkholderiales bacterium]|nr:FIST N-terminal domain-containing protein [Burkholderiales bacterium]
MRAQIAKSSNPSIDTAIAELKATLGKGPWRSVLYFASVIYDQYALAAKMQEAFAPADTFGCSSCGEIISGHVTKKSIVAMAFGDEDISDINIQMVENANSEASAKKAFGNFERHFGVRMQDMDHQKYVGIILVDGMSGSEEGLMDRIGNWTNVTFIGGSAGDDLKFQKTWVYANGRAASGAAVLVLMKPVRGFDIIKTQSFCEGSRKLVATKVDEASRAVVEFNGQNAVKVYAAAVNTTPDKAGNHFMSNPIGLIVNSEPYVRSPQRVVDGKLAFYCAVKEGMELSMLESTNIIEDTKNAIKQKLREHGGGSALINFNCILRTLEMEQKGQTEAYGKLFAEIPTIGFSTYGEEYIGHINQTATMLLLI